MPMTFVLAVLLAFLAGASARPARAETAVELNEAGVLIFNRARQSFEAPNPGEAGSALEEAIATFRAALAIDPAFEPARRNLATGLTVSGGRELTAGNLEEARRRLEEAAGLAPDDPRISYLLAVIAARRGKVPEARRLVERALELAPDSIAALALSGDLSYQEGSLGRALRAWEDALPHSSGPERRSLELKIERARKEYDAEGAFRREVSPHFTLQADGPVPRELARAALRELEDAYERLWTEFKRRPAQDIPVILYGRTTFRDLNPLAPVWASGTYDGKIRVPVGGLTSAADAARLRPILAHELTHAFLRFSDSTGGLPLWFEEGMAERAEGQRPDAARRLLGDRGARFSSLNEVDRALRSGDRVEAAYAAAFLAIDELSAADSRRPFELLAEMGRGRAFADAFRDAARMELPEFEARWRARLP